MKSRILSLLLVLAVVFTCVPSALAEEGVRETNFLTDQTHADVDYADMDVTPVTQEEFLAAVDAVEALLGDAANEAKVEEGFNKVADLFQTVKGNLSLLNIRMYHNAVDETVGEAYGETYALYVSVFDEFIFLIQDILKSDCDGFLRRQLTEDDILSYESYGGMTAEQEDLNNQIAAISSEYNRKYAEAQAFSYTYNGKTWTVDELENALNNGDVDVEEYNTVAYQLAKLRNDYLGPVYLKGLELNTRLAKTYGYDDYGTFSYIEEYGRDYDFDDVAEFAGAVKEYIVPLYDDIYSLFVQDALSDYDAYYQVFTADYTGEDTLEVIRPYIARMSSELLDAWDYMTGHGLYDIAPGAYKAQAGFTTMIAGYGAPFFFNCPTQSLYDFTTVIHEFGHYDNFFYHPNGWNDSNSLTDVAEVHSQGMELLFSRFYDEIFGDSGKLVEDYLMGNLLSAIIDGAMYGELEVYAATTPNVTLTQLNEKYREIAQEYGNVAEDDQRTELYGWIDIPHLTTQPMYYISYATSAAGAFSFWLEAQEDFNSAVDHYLQFVSQSVYEPFLSQFELAGLENPISQEYVEELAGAIYQALDVENRLAAPEPESPFSDVSTSAWYFESVYTVYQYGIMQGSGDGTFDPHGDASRGMAATVLWNLSESPAPEGEGYFTDVKSQWYSEAVNWAFENDIVHGDAGKFKGGANISREEIAVMLYNYTAAAGGDMSVTATELDFKDAASVHSWARQEMTWCVENQIFNGTDSNLLKPRDQITRAELATVMYNYLVYLMTMSQAAE